jgi:uncharacterized protein
LKININTIPEDGLSLDIEKDGKWFQHMLSGEYSCGFSPHRIDSSFSIRKVQSNVQIEGKIKIKAEMPCSRCLEIIDILLQVPFKYTFCQFPQRIKEETELHVEDLDMEYCVGDVIDLEQVVFEQVMLQIPVKPLCSESCKGLCPHCGANLNKTTCNCHDEILDQRLSALKQINLNH